MVYHYCYFVFPDPSDYYRVVVVVGADDNNDNNDDSAIAAASANRTTANTYHEEDYDDIYDSFGSHSSYSDRRLFDFATFHNYTSPRILRDGCPLTVAMVDPRPPTAGYNHPVWYALESLALFVPRACVVFHTASCQIIQHGSDRHKVHVVAKAVYERSLPKFRRMMERGQVRINIINNVKYGLQHCDSFGRGNHVFMSVRFWLDEFVDHLDSDTILTFQDDAVLCRSLDVDAWRHFAHVGAPWVPAWTLDARVGGAGCDSMRRLWKAWVPKCNGLTEYQAQDSMSRFCAPGYYGGLQGNGGLSLRNRNWMIEAIRRCPSEYSGLETFEEFGVSEDVYFSTILNGLNATMPTAFEASLFSVENLFPEQTLENAMMRIDEILATVQRLWGNETGMLVYERMHRRDSYPESSSELHTIPVGFHKPWWTVVPNVSDDVQIQKECKMLKFIVQEG